MRLRLEKDAAAIQYASYLSNQPASRLAGYTLPMRGAISGAVRHAEGLQGMASWQGDCRSRVMSLSPTARSSHLSLSPSVLASQMTT